MTIEIGVVFAILGTFMLLFITGLIPCGYRRGIGARFTGDLTKRMDLDLKNEVG